MAEMLNLVSEMVEETQKGKYLIFSLDREEYGIEIKYVTEIVGVQTITAVPELPEYIKGIINLRGKIIPIFDVRLRFKKEVREYNERTCIVVIDFREFSVGLIVDRVAEVIKISDEAIVPPPTFNGTNRFIKGIGKVGNGVKLILDCQRLLTDEELEVVAEYTPVG